MDLSIYADNILNIYNYSEGIIIVNREGIIEYFKDRTLGSSRLHEKDVLGKSLFDVYKNITPETSTLMEVMRTGKEIRNGHQELTCFNGESLEIIFNTLPIYEGKEIVGAVELVFYPAKSLNLEIENKPKLENRLAQNKIIFKSKIMENIYDRANKVANTDSPVMIYGETGTGKELFARLIHDAGKRKNKPFVAQNCAAIPANILESIIFGTTRGGFTDAENKAGLFEVANGGTLFLDEINSMDFSVQCKLLKVVEEQKVTRIGGTTEIPVNVRLVTALNMDPLKCVEKRIIREDLYYRLRVVQIGIPSLRERREDIEDIAKYYVSYFNKSMGKNIVGIDDDAMKMLQEYNWPGNVRELRNVIEYAFNFAETETITASDIVLEDTPMVRGVKAIEHSKSLKSKCEKYEKYLIDCAYKQYGNIQDAASALGITRQTMSKKLKTGEKND